MAKTDAEKNLQLDHYLHDLLHGVDDPCHLLPPDAAAVQHEGENDDHQRAKEEV